MPVIFYIISRFLTLQYGTIWSMDSIIALFHGERLTVSPLYGEGDAPGMSEMQSWKSGLFRGPGGGVGKRKGGGR